MAWIKPATKTKVLPNYWQSLIYLEIAWILYSAIFKKFNLIDQRSLRKLLTQTFLINYSFLSIITILLIGLKLVNYSRLIILGTILTTSFIEIIFASLSHYIRYKMQDRPILKNWFKIYFFAGIDILIVIFSFLLFAWVKSATIRIVIPQYTLYVLELVGYWLIISTIFQKYTFFKMKRFREIITKLIITDFIILSSITFFMLAFKTIHLSRFIFFGTFGTATLLEIFFAWIYFYAIKFDAEMPDFSHSTLVSHLKEPEDITETENNVPQKIKKVERYDPEFAKPIGIHESILVKLLNKYLKKEEKLFEFLNDSLALENIHKNNSTIINTATSFNIEHYDENSIEFFVNLHKLNDFRRINRYFIKVNEILKIGGVFVGCGETINERYNSIVNKYPKLISIPMFIIDFSFNRILPKISFLKGIYFAVTKGKNRPISKCEILGRLHSCGFKVINEKEIDGVQYYVAQKIEQPSEDKNPSYSPVFKMRRSGKGGKKIFVYKFRTMHPYAEFLQTYMVENYGYGDKGKVEADFRVTTWGKFMRKLWLDELPQLYNFMKGELSIVGVRPLSDRFLKEYPEDLKKERFKYKPGCVPPYVALRMQAVENYIESERIYLKEKKKHPIWTDIKYFWWAVFNILTNRIRSE